MNSNEYEKYEELSVKKLLKLIKKSLPTMIISVLVVAIISVIGFGIVGKSSKKATAGLLYNYASGNLQKAPDGTKLEFSLIKSDEILNKAMEKCGLKLNLETLKANVNITAVASETDAKVFQYTVTLDNCSGLKLKDAQASALLNSIITEYSVAFSNQYYGEKKTIEMISETLLADNDYIVACNKISAQILDILNIVEKLAVDETFVSPTYNRTFAELLNSFIAAKSADFAKLNSFIIFNCFSKDIETLKIDLNYAIATLENEIVVRKVQTDALLATMKGFNTSASGGPAVFAEMNAQYNMLMTTLNNLKIQQELLKNELKTMSGTIPAKRPTEADMLAETTKLFNSARTELNGLIEKLNIMQEEGSEAQRANQSVSISTEVVVSNGVSTKMAVLVTTLLILFTVCMSVWVTHILQKKADIKAFLAERDDIAIDCKTANGEESAEDKKE